MANEPKADAKEKVDPLFTGGMDPNEAASLLSGMLSEDNLDGTIKNFDQGDAEEENAPGSDDAPPVEEEMDESGDEDSYEEPESDDDSSEEEWDEDEGYEEDDEEPEDSYTVKVDGEDREVTLDELLSGYSYQAHNTRTAQQLSEDRKALTEESASIRESRDKYAHRLEQVEEALARSVPQEPDWEVVQKENPDGFAAEYAKWQHHKANLDAIETEKKSVENDRMEDFTRQLNEYRASEGTKLIEAVPEWSDSDKLKTEAEEIRAFALSRGFTDAELENVVDHRAVLMMRDAMRFQKARKGGKRKMEATKKRKAKGQTLKPGARRPRGKKPPRKAQSARRQFQSSGRVGDATEFLKHALADEDL